jgi:hypothetical protein
MTTENHDFSPWRWDKPVHWADIMRSLLMVGLLTDTNMSTNFKLRNLLKDKIASGEVIQVQKGLYRLARPPSQTASQSPLFEDA